MFWPAGFWGTPPAPLIRGGGWGLSSGQHHGQGSGRLWPGARRHLLSPQGSGPAPGREICCSGVSCCPDLGARALLWSAAVAGALRGCPGLPGTSERRREAGPTGSRRCTAPSGGVSAPGAAPAMGRRVGSVAVAAGATPDAQQNFLLRGWGPGPGGACPWSGGRTCFLCLLSGADTGEGWAAWGSVCGSRGVTVWRPRKCSGQCRC